MTYIAFETVELIEEEGTDFIVNETVEVFQNKQAWCHRASLFKNVADRSLRAAVC